MASDQLICVFEEATIYESDLNLLSGSNWLNDSVITFYFQHLQHRSFSEAGILFLSPGSVFVLFHEDEIATLNSSPDPDDFRNTFEGLDILNHELVFFPVNDNADVEDRGGSHWSLLILHIPSMTFLHADPSNNGNLKVARFLSKKLFQAACGSGKPSLSCISCPQQQNGYDCGVYILCYAEMIATTTKSSSSSHEEAWLATLESIDWSALTPAYVRQKRQEIRDLILACKHDG